MSLNKYKVFQLCFSNENNKTNVVFKINSENDYDFNLIITISNELYVKELDKVLVINNILSAFYNIDTKNHDFETKIDYSIKEKPKEIINEVPISEINSIVSNLINYMNDFKNKVLENEKDNIKIEDVVEDVKEIIGKNKEFKEEPEQEEPNQFIKEEVVEEEVKEEVVKEEVVKEEVVKEEVVKEEEEVKEEVVKEEEVKEEEVKEEVVKEEVVKEEVKEEELKEEELKEEVVKEEELKEVVKEEVVKEEVVKEEELKEVVKEEELKEEVKEKEVVEKEVVEEEVVEEEVVKEEEVKNEFKEENKVEEIKVEDVLTKDKPKYKIKTPDDIKNNFMNKKKPIIETKLLQLLNNDSRNTNVDFINLGNNKNSDIEEKIYYHLKLITLSSMDVSTNIVFIVTELMKFIDNYAIRGAEKKNIIISTIKKFLEDENYPNVEYIVNTVCPELIDILISIDKRKIMIKKKSSCFT